MNNTDHNSVIATRNADILVVDDTPENLRLVIGLLKEAGYKPRGVPNGELALLAVEKQPPDLILLDIRMPNMDGFQVCAALHEKPQSRDIPIIFLSALSDAADKVKAFEAGGVDYITKPFQPPEVLARVRTYLELAHNRAALAQARSVLEKMSQDQAANVQNDIVPPSTFNHVVDDKKADILVVDDEPENLRLMTELLHREGYRVRGVLTGELALQAVAKQPPDLILLDVVMPDMDGFEICAALREQPKSRDIPIIFLTVLTDIADKIRAFEVGGVDYIIKPINTLEMLARVNTHIRLWRMQCGLEQMVAERTAQLHASEECYRRIFETIAEGYLLAEVSGRILSVNPATVKILKYTKAEDLLDKDISDLLYVNSNNQEELKKHLNQYGQVSDFNTQFKQSDGTVISVECNLHWVRNPSGIPVAIEGTFRDITERKRTEIELQNYQHHLQEMVEQRTAELEQARDAAETANRAKSMFLANMSHELRTPLSAILGFSDLLNRDLSLSDEQKQRLAIIRKSGDHLLGLINDVLDIAKIEAGKVKLELAPLDLGDLVFNVTDMLGIRATEKCLQLQIDPASQFPRYIMGDEAKIRQILINLLTNAIKATSEGGVILRLSVNHNHAEHLIIEVEDSGCGIAPEDQAKIMEPFVQVGLQSKQQGTGLGLAITRQFVELMNGNLSLISEVGKGSVFRAEIQVQLAMPESIPPRFKTAGEVIGLAHDQATYRMLVVEDQADNRQLLMDVLSSVGFVVQPAANGAEAVAQFEHWQPHLIWMDMRMPVMDGYEATRRIRALANGKQVKIIALTASTFSEQRQSILDAGCDAVVNKPYQIYEIFDTIATQLGVRYLYKDVKKMPTQAQFSEQELHDAISSLPDKVLAELIQAAQICDSEHFQAVLTQIEPHHPARLALHTLVEEYRFDRILSLTEQSQSL
jgi:PAS domain S-box-containing protein